MNASKLKPETKQKRDKRKAERAVLRENNKIGDRIIWIREKLKINRADIVEGTTIRPSTLSDWECGIRTKYYEWIGVIAKFCDHLWKEKFQKPPYPLFNGVEIDEITLEFILMGENPSLASWKQMAEDAEKKANQMMMKWEMTKALERLESGQMDMFDEEDENDQSKN